MEAIHHPPVLRRARRFPAGIGLALLGACAWLGPAALGGDPAPPPAPARQEVATALARLATRAGRDPAGPLRLPHPLRVLLLADAKDHGAEEHDYPLWQQRWALLLGGRAASSATQVNLFGPPATDPAAVSGVEGLTILRAQNWPSPAQFAEAGVIVAFCYLPWTAPRKAELQRFLDRGGGLVLIHSATWTMPGPDPGVAKLTGVGGFLRCRHGPVELQITAPGHPLCQGLPARIKCYDETYWPPVPPLAGALFTTLAVSEEASDSGVKPAPQPIFWASQNGPGRVFGCVPGHYTWTFDDPWFRLLLLRGIAWAGGQPATCLDALALRGARVAP
jgi:hypothetical protein